jgi:hypothetical protein
MKQDIAIDNLNSIVRDAISKDSYNRDKYNTNFERCMSHIFWKYNCSIEFLDYWSEYFTNVLWTDVSSQQMLSEDFIEKWAHRLDWYYICLYQDVNKKFLLKFINHVNIKGLKNRVRIDLYGYKCDFTIEEIEVAKKMCI